MTDRQIGALIDEQDQLMVSRAQMLKNAHMFSSGTELFRSFQSIDRRYNEIQRILDAA